MKNYVQMGDNLTITYAGLTAVSSGDLVVTGSLVGVAQADAVAGEDLTIVRTGVFDLTKVSTQVWAVGDLVYATAAGVATSTATGNKLVGVAVAATANPSETGRVLLDGAAR